MQALKIPYNEDYKKGMSNMFPSFNRENNAIIKILEEDKLEIALKKCKYSVNKESLQEWECSKYILIFNEKDKRFRIIFWEDQSNKQIIETSEVDRLSLYIMDAKINGIDIERKIQHGDIPTKKDDIVVWGWYYIKWKQKDILLGWRSKEFGEADLSITEKCLKDWEYNLIEGDRGFFKKLWEPKNPCINQNNWELVKSFLLGQVN